VSNQHSIYNIRAEIQEILAVTHSDWLNILWRWGEKPAEKESDKILHGYCQIIWHYFLQILFKSVEI